MKQITLIILALSLSMSVTAQEKVKQKEVGISLASIEEFGFTFKTGTDKSLWRFNTLLVSGMNLNQTEEDFTYERKNMELTVAFGKEYRKEITKNLELRLGADFSFSYEFSKYEENYTSVDDEDEMSESKTYSPGINLVFGFNYVINSNFIIGAEVLPGVSYEKKIHNGNSPWGNYESSDFSYNLSNSSALLSFAYRF